MMRVRKPVIILDFNEVFTSLFYKCVIPNKVGTVLQFPELKKCKSNGVIEPSITWEMHGRQGEHSNRSQAVEKAMKMKIKKVKPICGSA